MKTILVLTDLTPKAENAALYALRMAEKTRSDIILFHCFTVFRSVVVPETGMLPLDDYENCKEESLTELNKLAQRLKAQQTTASFIPQISFDNEWGNLEDNVEHTLLEKDIALIVMGTRSDNLLSHLLSGSDTSHILNSLKCPVLFVPDSYGFHPFKTIVYANDLKKAYPQAVSFLVDIAKVNASQIIVTHVGEEGEFNTADCLKLITEVHGYPNVLYRQLPEGSVIEQIKTFVNFLSADLTVMIHHKHSLLGELIPGSTSKKMLYKHTVPLLILPDE